MNASDDRIVVIGSGPTGTAAALALAERGFPVTVLESGTRDLRALRIEVNGIRVMRRAPSIGSPLPFQTDAEHVVWHHELAPGGLSNHWTGAVPRFASNDFTDGRRLGEEYEWPLRYRDLEPFYAWVEQRLLVTGSPHDVPGLPAGHRYRSVETPKSWRKFAREAAGSRQGVVPIPLAAGRPWAFSRDPMPFTSSTLLRHAAARRGTSLRVIGGHHALRLLIDNDGNVSAVECFDRAKNGVVIVKCAGVILAAGAIGTPKLLLDSTSVRFPDGLGNDHAILGRYLQDHTKEWALIHLDQPAAPLGHPLYLTRAAFESSEPLSGVGYTFSARTRRRDRLTVHLRRQANTFAFSAFGMEPPSASNRVSLHEAFKDPFGLPQVSINSRFGPQAMKNLDSARSGLLELLDGAGLRPTLVWYTNSVPPGESVHWSGSARMHRSPTYGMCDHESRLHSVPNVAVADSSTFTTPVEKNPTLTAMALAARAAGALARDLGRAK